MLISMFQRNGLKRECSLNNLTWFCVNFLRGRQRYTSIYFGALISNQLTTNVNTNTQRLISPAGHLGKCRGINQAIIQVINTHGYWLFSIDTYFSILIDVLFLFDFFSWFLYFNWRTVTAMFLRGSYPKNINLAKDLYEAMFLSWIQNFLLQRTQWVFTVHFHFSLQHD